MEIIAFEGIDKCGKATQTNVLVEKLRKAGKNVVKSEFHRYDTPTGKLIQEWLYKKYDVDDQTIEFIMAADKQAQQQWFKQLNHDGVDFLVLDRYILSQEVYAISKGLNKIFVQMLQSCLIKPGVEILIDIPADLSMNRKGKHGDNDRYEEDFKFLNSVRTNYLSLCSQNGIDRLRTIIDGTQTIDKVSDDIWNYVKKLYKI